MYGLLNVTNNRVKQNAEYVMSTTLAQRVSELVQHQFVVIILMTIVTQAFLFQ